MRYIILAALAFATLLFLFTDVFNGAIGKATQAFGADSNYVIAATRSDNIYVTNGGGMLKLKKGGFVPVSFVCNQAEPVMAMAVALTKPAGIAATREFLRQITREGACTIFNGVVKGKLEEVLSSAVDEEGDLFYVLGVADNNGRVYYTLVWDKEGTES